jgi:tetratricopeptide (TPR) repeat protein
MKGNMLRSIVIWTATIVTLLGLFFYLLDRFVGGDKTKWLTLGLVVMSIFVAIVLAISEKRTKIGEASHSSIGNLHQLHLPPDFTGRNKELKELCKREQNGVRIFYLQGMGGIGKTALAFKFADILKKDYPDAQFYLDLKGLPLDSGGNSQNPLSPAEIMWHVVSSYNSLLNRTDKVEDARTQYYSLLNGKRALLLLDNAKDATQIDPIIPPEGCLLIVTSRQHTHLPEPSTFTIEKMSRTDAKELLLKIAPSIGEYAEQIARQCDYLPLALQLAAKALGKNRTFKPADLIKQLKDGQERLGFVEASFNQSYELLGAEHQRRWRTLAVFPDTFDVNATAAVWETETDAAKELLADLDSYSLLEWNKEEDRFHLHDLARDFANARLEKSVRSERYEAQRRHARYYSSVLKKADSKYFEGQQEIAQGFSLFELEENNIRVGQAWAMTNADQDDDAAHIYIDYANNGIHILFTRLYSRDLIAQYEKVDGLVQRLKSRQVESMTVGNLGIAYYKLGNNQRAIECSKRALELAREIKDTKGECDRLGDLGLAYTEIGSYQDAINCFEQALKLACEIKDKRRVCSRLRDLGIAYIDLSKYEQAIECLKQALIIAHEMNDKQRECECTGNLGIIYTHKGDHKQAIDYFEKAVKIAREMHDRKREGTWLDNLGMAYTRAGKHKQAIKYCKQALEIAHEVGDRQCESKNLGSLGIAYRHLRDHQQAIAYSEQALEIAHEVGDKHSQYSNLVSLAYAYRELGEKQRELDNFKEALKLADRMGERMAKFLCLKNLGTSFMRLDEYQQAVDYFEQAKQLAEQLNDKKNVDECREQLDVAKSRLGI